jgi:hypothetical protein
MFAATQPYYISFLMPRPCAVEIHVQQLNSREREAPRDEPVASGRKFLVAC